MKYYKLFCFSLLFLLVGSPVFAVLFSSTPPTAHITNDSKLSIQEKIKLAQMQWFASLSVADCEKYSGKKLNFFGRMAFKMNQRQMQRKLKNHYYGDEPNKLTKIG